METPFLNAIKNAIKHWYLPLFVGIFFVVVSAVVFTSPVASLLTLSFLFAMSFMFGGLAEAVFSFVNRKELENWGWSLAFGAVTFIVGTSLVINPVLSIGILAFYIGFVLLFRSVSAISFAIDLKRYGSKNWAMLLVLGVLGIIFSFILILNPVLVALSFLFTGLFSVFLSLQLRKLHKSPKKMSAKLKERYDDLVEDMRKEWDD